MKKFSFAVLTLLGALAVPVASQADPLLVGQISTYGSAGFGSTGPRSSFGITQALLSGDNSYAASKTVDDYFVSSTADMQISNNDSADVAKISFTGATNLFANTAESSTVTEFTTRFSVTAPVAYLIQSNFKGELSDGEIGATSSSSLITEDGGFLDSYSYLEQERSDSVGTFHHAANLTNDGNGSGFLGSGSPTGFLMPDISYFIYEYYRVDEGLGLVNVSGLSLANYSITFTRLSDDGSGGGDGTGGGSGGGGGGGGGTATVPDSGSSAGLVSLGMVALAVIRRRYGHFPVSLLPA